MPCPLLQGNSRKNLLPSPFSFSSRWGRRVMKRTNRTFCRDEHGITWSWFTSIRNNMEVLYLVGLTCRESGWSASHEIQYVGSLYSSTPERLSIKFSIKTTTIYLLTKVKTLLASLPKYLQTCVLKHIYDDKLGKWLKICLSVFEQFCYGVKKTNLIHSKKIYKPLEWKIHIMLCCKFCFIFM